MVDCGGHPQNIRPLKSWPSQGAYCTHKDVYRSFTIWFNDRHNAIVLSPSLRKALSCLIARHCGVGVGRDGESVVNTLTQHCRYIVMFVKVPERWGDKNLNHCVLNKKFGSELAVVWRSHVVARVWRCI